MQARGNLGKFASRLLIGIAAASQASPGPLLPGDVWLDWPCAHTSRHTLSHACCIRGVLFAFPFLYGFEHVHGEHRARMTITRPKGEA